MALRSDAIQNSIQNSNLSQTTSGRGMMRSRAGNALMVSEGQVLKGVVTDIHGRQITIQMDDGTTFTGQLPDASNYTIGQGAAFQVTGTSGGTIYMQAMTDAYLLGVEDTINQALEEAGLPKSPRNLEIVRSLLNNQQSISRQNITDTIKLCAQFPNQSASSVITAKHLALPLTEATISQLEQYQNQNHQILNKMNTLTDSLNQILDVVGEKAPDISGTIADKILTLALEPSDFLEDPTKTVSSEIVENSVITDAVGNPIPEELTLPLDENGEPLQPGQVVLNESGELVPIESLPTDEEGNPVLPAPFAQATPDEIEYAPDQLGSKLAQNARETLSAITDTLPLSDEIKAGIKDGTITNKEFLTNIQNALSSMSGSQSSTLVSNPQFQLLLKDQLISGWSIAPRAFAEKGNIEKLYEKIDRQLETLSNLSRSVSSQSAFRELGDQASNLKDNLHFMKTLNQSFTYMQLPLKLQEENAHGDLYVMTRKGAMKQNPDKLRVLLHLEMDNLGQLDIHIQKEKTNVTTTFYVENEKTKALLNTNIDLLKDAINEQGYSFSSDINMKEKEIDIVKDFMAKDKPIGNMKRYSFDLRA